MQTKPGAGLRAGMSQPEARQHNASTAASLALLTLSVAVEWLTGLSQRLRWAC